jgi:hypothetical protein
LNKLFLQSLTLEPPGEFYLKEGLEANRKICQKQQTELRHRLLSEGKHQSAVQLFFKQHAMLHSASMAQSEHFSLEDEVFENLSEDKARLIPRTSENSIVWNIWHIARIEDVTMNMLVAGREQVFTEGEWQIVLGIENRDTGNAMPAELIIRLSQNIVIPALRAYRVAVGRRTGEIVMQLPPANLKDKVDPARLVKVQSSGAVIPAASGLIEYWRKRTIAGLLLMPATRHNLIHLNECLRLKEKKS